MPEITVKDSDTDNTTEPTTQNDPVAQQEAEVVKSPRIHRKKIYLAAAVLLMVLLVGGLIYLLQDRNDLKQEVNKLSQTQQPTEDEAAQLNAAVGALIELPSDETPTVATVVDVEKVKDQVFFARAQNGDKVLLYAKSSKAILYRPSTNKIIEVAPIDLSNTGASDAITTPTTNKNR